MSPVEKSSSKPSPMAVLPLEALPARLALEEAELVRQRREYHAASTHFGDARVGVALSGGGIRSATFSLGVFQTLARTGLLRRIDYLSTVSGGGYFGAFLGALFARFARAAEGKLADPSDPSLRYLRENGCYLAPAGTSDLVLGGAVLLRNWLAIQVVIATTLLLVFTLVAAIELWCFSQFTQLSPKSLLLEGAFAQQGVWLSPWLWLPALLVAFVAAPLGWAYFSLERERLPSGVPNPAGLSGRVWQALPHALVVAGGAYLSTTSHEWGVGLVAIALLAYASALLAPCQARIAVWLPWLYALVLSTWFIYAAPYDRALVKAPVILTLLTLLTLPLGFRSADASANVPETSDNTSSRQLSADGYARHRVSEVLKGVLVAIGATLAFAVVDSIARTLYVAYTLTPEWGTVMGVSGGVGTLLVSAAALSRSFVVKAVKGEQGQRVTTKLSTISWIAAIALLLVVLTGAGVATQTIAWQADPPARRVAQPHASPLQARQALTAPPAVAIDLVVEVERPAPATPAFEHSPELTAQLSKAAGRCGWAALIALLLSITFGTSRVLLNRSTHQPLYSARLTRAFLGATNEARYQSVVEDDGQPDPGAATRVMPNDDIPDHLYWGWKVGEGEAKTPWSLGGPLHIVNLTLNETVDGRSRIRQQDRKGLGLAVGPVALSAGVRHHLIPGDATETACTSKSGGYTPFRFTRGNNRSYPTERMSIGQWVSISGAAFSTGLGSRTHIALSLLAGFANVRLGHWWRPGVERPLTFARAFGALFWVQTYLFRELTARFPGTQNKLWYLSDGGHFENMGAYELIRRRVEFIVIVDGEADADYGFEGLANLVRKARLDFGAEIEFLDDPLAQWQASKEADPSEPDCPDASEPQPPLGPLCNLKRGKWKLSEVGDGKRFVLESVDATGCSLGRAALAKIHYGPRRSSKPHAAKKSPTPPRDHGWLLYVKPALLGNEPADLTHYAASDRSFPHQSTGDQFFDEAQWESYRKLGQLTAEQLFISNTHTYAQGAQARFTCLGRMFLGQFPHAPSTRRG